MASWQNQEIVLLPVWMMSADGGSVSPSCCWLFYKNCSVLVFHTHTLPHTLGSSQWLILLDQYEQHHHSPMLHPTWSLPAAGGVTDIVPCFSDAHLQTRAACRWVGLGPGWGLWPGDRPAAPGSPSAPGPPESTSLPAGELRAPPSASGSPAEHKHTFIHTCINEPHKYSVRKKFCIVLERVSHFEHTEI